MKTTGKKRRTKRHKGHDIMCSTWIRGDGMAFRLLPRDLRRLGGKTRRVGRHDVGDE